MRVTQAKSVQTLEGRLKESVRLLQARSKTLEDMTHEHAVCRQQRDAALDELKRCRVALEEAGLNAEQKASDAGSRLLHLQREKEALETEVSVLRGRVEECDAVAQRYEVRLEEGEEEVRRLEEQLVTLLVRAPHASGARGGGSRFVRVKNRPHDKEGTSVETERLPLFSPFLTQITNFKTRCAGSLLRQLTTGQNP